MFMHSLDNEIYQYNRTTVTPELLFENNNKDIISPYWESIRSRLHENSGLRDPSNEVGKILNVILGALFEEFDDFIDGHILESFLLTASQAHLNRIGKEWDVYRKVENGIEEEDDSYRQRILNKIILTISIIFLERQGLRNYSKKNVDDDSRLYMTSYNPHTSNKYDTIPKTTEALQYILNDIIFEYTCQIHKKGW